jgi:hypothetical protein
MDIEKINQLIQDRMAQEGIVFIKAVEAAKWLDEAGLLKDSMTRKGKPLRDLLRQELIWSAWQDTRKRWIIDRNE